jgi:hypothetical protein
MNTSRACCHIGLAIKGNASQIRPHPSASSSRTGEGEPDWKSLSRSGRVLKAYGIKEKGEGKCIDNSCRVNRSFILGYGQITDDEWQDAFITQFCKWLRTAILFYRANPLGLMQGSNLIFA